jgi:eukaryotic-like serine/threonine-protein kinase
MLGMSGKYRLDSRLGGGGMAEVFLGSMLGVEGFSRRVAIKRVLPGFSDNPAFAQMFVAEAQISSRLQHPNIVSVLDFDRDAEGRLFLVMELVDGRDLDALCASGPLPFPVIIFVISEVLRGLGHAHDLPSGHELRGIVHRDVSPHNVLLSWAGAVKVSDFGIAKARQASEATASVFIKGKPAYMSPEQANGQPLDGRSDLFAVGVMLWEMLTGRRLFVGEDTRATLAAVLFGQIPRPRSVRSDVPKDLEKVAMKLLERDLPARYATAEHAIHDLLECHDAPKNGREQLIRLLAERFPHNAPVRDSTARSRGAESHAQPYSSLGPAQPTMVQSGGAMLPHTPVPSIGDYRSTPTNTMQPAPVQPMGSVLPLGSVLPMAAVHPPRQRGAKLALILVAMLAAAFVTVALVVASGRTHDTTTDAGEPASGSLVADAAVDDTVATAPVDASPAIGSDAQVTTAVQLVHDAGAGIAEPTKKDAPSGHSGEKRMGRLVVRAFPVLTVYVGNKKIHDTPVDMKLPAGKHKLRLVNSDVGKNETLTVTIEDNKTTTIERN